VPVEPVVGLEGDQHLAALAVVLDTGSSPELFVGFDDEEQATLAINTKAAGARIFARMFGLP